MSLLRTVRAPLSVIVLAGIAVVLPPQSRDMLAALGDGDVVLSETVVFYLALALLTFSGWYWSRALISARFDVPYTDEVARSWRRPKRASTCSRSSRRGTRSGPASRAPASRSGSCRCSTTTSRRCAAACHCGSLRDVRRWNNPPQDPGQARLVSPSLQLLAPIAGLHNVRGGHSAVLLRAARDAYGTSFVHFICPGTAAATCR